MSAKWRRSRKKRKWIDLTNVKLGLLKPCPKIARMENPKPTRTTPKQNCRFFKRVSNGRYKEPKPLVDMFQDKTSVTVVAQIAGFTQDNFKIAIKEQKLTLSAKARDRKYYKSLNLPKVVIPTVAHTTFKNGVLEIKLKKAQQIPNNKTTNRV